MGTAVDVDDEDEEDIEQMSAQLHKSVHCSLSTLCDWYSSKTKVGPRSLTRLHYVALNMVRLRV